LKEIRGITLSTNQKIPFIDGSYTKPNVDSPLPIIGNDVTI